MTHDLRLTIEESLRILGESEQSKKQIEVYSKVLELLGYQLCNSCDGIDNFGEVGDDWVKCNKCNNTSIIPLGADHTEEGDIII